MLDIQLLKSEDWLRLQDTRLAALQESPDAFLSTYEREKEYGKEQWQAEFARGDWYIGALSRRPVSLLGVTREQDMPEDKCYLEFLWVSAEWRGFGAAIEMMTYVLGQLRKASVRTAFLWVLDDNHPARCLYKRLGFVSANKRQPLPANPGRCEELMRLDLDSAVYHNLYHS